MIRIAHVVPTLSRGSGMMSFIMNYYRHIDRTKIQFDFIYFTDIKNDYTSEILLLGGKIYKIDKPTFSKRNREKLYDFFSGKDFNALHCHPIFSSFIFSKPAKKSGIQYIVQHSHSSKYSNKKISAIRNYLISWTFHSYVTHFIAASSAAAVLFKGKFIPKSEINIVNNAIDPVKYIYNCEDRNSIREELKVEESDFVIGHIGRFATEKNHFYLVDLFENIFGLNPRSKLLLVGDGPLKKDVKKYIREKRLEDHVIILGLREDIGRILSGMDVFILPSKFEGLGLVAIESQASGLVTYCSTGVAKEAFITNLAKEFSLKEDLHQLALIINEEENNYRIKDKNILSGTGFDVREEISELEKIYLSMKK